MSFVKKTVEENIAIWEECIKTPFFDKMLSGKLPMETFGKYIVQDSIYLKGYARVIGKAIFLAKTLRDVRTYYAMLGFVTESESAVRLSFLKKMNMTDDDIESAEPMPVTNRYLEFLCKTAENDNENEILMSILPCMLSYSYIFRIIAKKSGNASHEYREFISEYADKSYAEDCDNWLRFAEEKTKKISETEKEKLRTVFKTGSLLELEFWKMAGGEAL